MLWVLRVRPFDFVLKLIDLGIKVSEHVLLKRKHKREIDSLQQENQECCGTIVLYHMVILFLVAVLLLAYRDRETA